MYNTFERHLAMSILKIHTLVPNNKVQIQQKLTQAKRNAQITITLLSTEQVGEKKNQRGYTSFEQHN